MSWCFKICVIIGLSVFCYLNALQNELCFDDMFAVLYNADSSPEQPYLPVWRHDFWGHDISSNQSHKSYRPVTITYFRLIRQYTLSVYTANPNTFLINNLTMKEKQIHPEYIHREKDLQPFYLHLGNMVLHSLNSLFVAFLILLLFDDEKEYNSDLSFISSLLFATHPIHVEAVTGIVGAAELLSCFFGLLSFFCYVFAHSAYFNNISFYKPVTSNAFVAFLFWCGISSMFYCLSALSKETGVTISGLMSLYSMFKCWQQLTTYYKMNTIEIEERNLALYFYFYFNLLINFTLLLIPMVWLILYLRLRQYLGGVAMAVGHEIFRRIENPIAFESELVTRSLTIPYLHYYYLSLLVCPHPLSADYSFNCIPMIESINDHRNICWIITYLLLFVALIYSAFKILHSMFSGVGDESNKYWNIVIMFAWMIVPFMPASNLFFFVATFVAERLLYLPSIGFCMLLSYVLIHLIANKLLLYSVVAVILSLYVSKTYDRNKEWRNEETLFDAAYKVCPQSVKVLQNAAILDRRHLRFDESLSKLYRAKEIDATFCEADHWIGVTLVNKGDVMSGLELLKKSLDCKFASKDTAESLQKLFQMLLEWSPQNAVFTHEWGSILYRLDQKDNEHGAYFYLQQALNHFILGAMQRVMAEDGGMDNLDNGMAVFANKLDVADRMEDILEKLSEENKHGLIDCFHKLAEIIIDYYRISHYLQTLQSKQQNDGFYAIDDMLSSNKKKLKKKKKLKTMDLRQNLLPCLKYLAETAWKSIVDEGDCKQEMENVDTTPSWQKTWNYFALNIVGSVLKLKKENYNLQHTDNEFWAALSKQVETMQKVWNEYRAQTSKKKKAMEAMECAPEMFNRYSLLEETLSGKSRADHFWALLSLKEQIDETMAVLKHFIESDSCDLKTKMWSLEGMAIIITPYIKENKVEWNFDGLLEDETLINRLRQTGKGMYVQPTIEMIAALYPYLQNKMKVLAVNDFLPHD